MPDIEPLSKKDRNKLIMKLPPEQRKKALSLVKEEDEIEHFNQWDYYKPYKKQVEFHHKHTRERLL